MRRRKGSSSGGWSAAVGAGAVLALTACGPSAPEETPLSSEVQRVRVELSSAAAVPDLIAAADALGLDLLALAGDETTVTSPAGLQVTLSMAAEGAEGPTLDELEALVGATGQERSDGVNALTAALADLDGDPAVARADELPDTPVVHRAARLVLDDSLEVEQAFVDALARSYDAPALTTDLADEGASAVLDAWVDEHTGGLVPRSAITPGPELRLVLQDAVVLAARWEQPFLAELTQPAPFVLASGEEVEVDMMSTAGPQDMRYAEVAGWRAVRLPYTDGRLAAEVVLPPSGSTPTDLAPEDLVQIRAELDAAEPTPVLLRMPVVDVESSLDLGPYLAERAPAALRGGFGGISAEPLFVSQAVQQGVLVIDEDGTLAAAVTEMGMAGSAPVEEPFELTVDRPYLVRIIDARTGWALFLAHVADPRGER